MKKIILATTALVATAGFAAAGDISLNAAAKIGVDYTGKVGAAKATSVVITELDFGINASGESDNGVAFGASLDLDTTQTDTATTQNVIGDPEAYIAFGGLKLTVGAVDAADDGIQNIADAGLFGIGVDNIAEAYTAGGSHNINVSYALDSVSFVVSTGSDSKDAAIAVSGSFSGFNVAVGYNTDKTTGAATKNTATLALGYKMDAFSVNALFAQQSATGAKDLNAMGLSVGYSMNALTLTATYAQNDSAHPTKAGKTQSGFGIGASYDLGGGLSVAGGFGEVNDVTQADFGVAMKF
ncbi:porin [Pseudoprimorskyibacter insulae]|uniref:Porin domain-containing protein n=1 Tax=Pseudoprimorskyibacter insulae TaxID=1695997 RepID=A0A2R8ANR5_9RHOB|nr:porin [Pseudoprimorskyibacter insulae]SPF77663.1 hypothetical protein PRI8871_00247 [Pseudoprimorskyibacter insulae]